MTHHASAELVISVTPNNTIDALKGPEINKNLHGPPLAEARLLHQLHPPGQGFKGPQIQGTLHGPSFAETRILQDNPDIRGPDINKALHGPSLAETRILEENPDIRGPDINKALHGPSAAETRLLEEIGPDVKGPEINKALHARPLAETRLLQELCPTEDDLKGPEINRTLHGPSQAETRVLQELNRTTRPYDPEQGPGSEATGSVFDETGHLFPRQVDDLQGDNLAGPALNDRLYGPSVAETKLLQEQQFANDELIGRAFIDALSGPSKAEAQLLEETAQQNGGLIGAGLTDVLEGPSAAEQRILHEQARDGEPLKGPLINDVLYGRVSPEEWMESEDNLAWITKADSSEDADYTILTGEVYGAEDERAMNAAFEYWYRYGMGEEQNHQTICRKYGISVDLLQSYLKQLSPASRQKLIEAGMRAAEKHGTSGHGHLGGNGIVAKGQRQRAPIEQRHPLDSAHDPLQTPLQAADYLTTERLEQLLLPDQLQRTCFRLLNARELIKFAAEGGRMERRQDLELSNPQLFCSPELLRELLEEAGRDRECVDLDGREVVFYPGIVVLSYAWVEDEHPDPKGEQLRELAKALEWYMSERARLRLRVKREMGAGGAVEGKVSAEEAPSTAMCGVLLDYTCLHQPPFLGYEGDYFQRELFNLPLLYGHALTMKLQAADTKGGLGDRVWERRGWCHLEGRLAELISPRDYCLNLASFPLSKAATSHQLGTAAGYKKSGAQLAAQGDGQATHKFLKAMAPPPRALVGPDHIRAELEAKVFSEREDVEVCLGMYVAAASTLLAVKESLLLAGCALSQAEVLNLPGVLNACPALRKLEIAKCGLSGERAARVLEAVEPQGLSCLERLDLSENPLTDAIATPLSEALGARAHLQPSCRCLGRPRAPRCKVVLETLYELILEECSLGPRGFSVLLEAAGVELPALAALNLSLNPVGDQGMQAFRRLKRQAFPALEDLRLAGCDVSDAGALVLVESLAASVMPAIHLSDDPTQTPVDLTRNRIKHAPSALEAVLRERGVRGQQGTHGVLRSHHSAAAAVSKLREQVREESGGGCVVQ